MSLDVKSTADDMMSLLDGESAFSLTFKENLFVDREPSSPDDCVTIFNGPGSPPIVTLEGGSPFYFYPSFQVRVRNRSDRVAYRLSWDIMSFLHGYAPVVIGDMTYLSIVSAGEPFLLNWDENGRAHFITNFEVQRRI